MASDLVNNLFKDTAALELNTLKKKLDFSLNEASDKILGLRQEIQFQNIKDGLSGEFLNFQNQLQKTEEDIINNPENIESNFSGMVSDFEGRVRNQYIGLIDGIESKEQRALLERGMESKLLKLKRNALRSDYKQGLGSADKLYQDKIKRYGEALNLGEPEYIFEQEENLKDYLKGLRTKGTISEGEYKAKSKQITDARKIQAVQNIVQENLKMEFKAGPTKALTELEDTFKDQIDDLPPKATEILFKRLNPLRKQRQKFLGDIRGALKQELTEQKQLTNSTVDNIITGEESFNTFEERNKAKLQTINSLLPGSKLAERKKLVSEKNKALSQEFIYKSLKENPMAFPLLSGDSNTEENRKKLFPAYDKLPQDVKHQLTEEISKITKGFNDWKNPENIEQFINWVDTQGANLPSDFENIRQTNLEEAVTMTSQIFGDSPQAQQLAQNIANIASTSEFFNQINGQTDTVAITDKQQKGVMSVLSNILDKGDNIVGFTAVMNYFQDKGVNFGSMVIDGSDYGQETFNDMTSIFINSKNQRMTSGFGKSLEFIKKGDKDFLIHFETIKDSIEELTKNDRLYGGDLEAISLNENAAKNSLIFSIAGDTFQDINRGRYSDTSQFKAYFEQDYIQDFVTKRTKLSNNIIVNSEENKGWISKTFGVNIGRDARKNKNTARGVEPTFDDSSGAEIMMLQGSLTGGKTSFLGGLLNLLPTPTKTEQTLASKDLSTSLYGLISNFYKQNGSANELKINDLENRVVVDNDGSIKLKNIGSPGDLVPLQLRDKNNNIQAVSINKNKLKELMEKKGIPKGRIAQRFLPRNLNLGLEDLLNGGVFQNLPDEVRDDILNNKIYSDASDYLYKTGPFRDTFFKFNTGIQ